MHRYKLSPRGKLYLKTDSEGKHFFLVNFIFRQFVCLAFESRFKLKCSEQLQESVSKKKYVVWPARKKGRERERVIQEAID